MGSRTFPPAAAEEALQKSRFVAADGEHLLALKTTVKQSTFLLDHSAITEGTKIKNISFHLVKRGTTAVLPLVPESAGCFLSSSHTEQGNSRCLWALEAKWCDTVVYAETSTMQVCEHVCMHIN